MWESLCYIVLLDSVHLLGDIVTMTFRKLFMLPSSGEMEPPGLRLVPPEVRQIRLLTSFNLKEEAESSSETSWF